ncbi:unnamed protein product [Porites evermanni]|uniref:Uncharacterized protein n=1 Tax=Porites evermanni TaxID=104178 RepID=A0ABN8N082_9CNID|nr:unnamed protein product [Porites evermanni]
MATFYSYLLVFYCLSLVHGQLQMEINRDSNLKIFEFLTTLSGTHCSSTAGCDLLFTDETVHLSISSISPIGVTQKAINVPANNTCSFYFGEKLHAQYIGCDGDWREIPSNSVNESLETRDTASSFLRKNPGRIFRVAVQCRHQRKNAVAKSTCVMFKVPGTIYCPIPQQNSSKPSATLPPPTLEITSTTGFPPRPTTLAEKVTTCTQAVVTTEVWKEYQATVLNLRLSSEPLRVLPNARGLPSNFTTTYNSKAYALPSSRRQHSARRLPIKQDGLVYRFPFDLVKFTFG